MERREILQTVALAAVAGGSGAAHPPPAPPTAQPRIDGPFVVTRDGQRLFHRDWGTGRPIVFLAAWALPSAMWDYQMTALVEDGFRCVAYDRRGHGRSSQPGGGYDYDTLADDLAAVLDALDLRDV